MRCMFACIEFLSRIPVPGAACFDAAGVGRDQGAWCMKRIGGITGDTMGANTEAGEARVFVVLLGPGEG